MKIIFYDFEVFLKDWMVVLIDYDTKDRVDIINNKKELISFYDDNKESIWIGYNNRGYDQFILKGIMLGMNPHDITKDIIENNIKGYHAVKGADSIHLNNFDMSNKFNSLKQLEGFMGSTIKESSVDFHIQRKLTDDEIKEVMVYCNHDVEQTIEVFDKKREEFDSQLALIDAFDLSMEMFNKTKAQLSAHILGCNKPKESRGDNFKLTIPSTIRLSEKYDYILKWYENDDNMDYKKSQSVDVAGVPHIFAWGGLHGAKNNYMGEGDYIMSDIASMYPAIMIEYDFLSRNVTEPQKYRKIRDDRLILKKKKDPRQLPMKIVLNGTFGASKDQYNDLYDPLMANNVCVAGQLMLLDLIEKIEPFGELIQSNTDGILVKLHDGQRERYLEECDKWSARVRLDLEHDDYKAVIQKDVNNYVIIEPDGGYKSKGAYVKKLNAVDYDLPIVNKALLDYFTKQIPLEDTIMNCNLLKEFQKIVKVSSKYNYALHGDEKIREKVLRVFASKDESDGGIFKVKGEDKIEKMGSTPDCAFIYNDEVNGVEIPSKLDKDYYLEVAKDRLDRFTNPLRKSTTSNPSDIKGVNLDAKILITNTYSDILANNKKSFIECLRDMYNLEIKQAQIQTMIKVGYFTEYWQSGKLLTLWTLYKTYNSKKTHKIDNLEIPHDIVRRYCEKETDKQFTKVDYLKVLIDFEKQIEDTSIPCLEMLQNQAKYLGYYNYKNPEMDKRYVYVTALDTKYSPKAQCYCLNNGASLELKVKNKPKSKKFAKKEITYYQDVPFEIGELLYVNKFSHEHDVKKLNEEQIAELSDEDRKKVNKNGWITLNSKSWWITNYYKVQ